MQAHWTAASIFFSRSTKNGAHFMMRVSWRQSGSDDINTLRRILREARTIAVVGLSADWYRPSYFAAKYMQEHGYRIVPVNPKYAEILGEKCYRSVRDVPVKIDLVDVFRKTA